MYSKVTVRSAEQYFEEFGRERIGRQRQDKETVRKDLIAAFQKEIFTLVEMRAKKKFDDIPPEGDPEALRIAANVVKDATRKWKKLYGYMEMYRETSGVIDPMDISFVPEKKNEGIGFEDGNLILKKELEEDPAESNGMPKEDIEILRRELEEDPAESNGMPEEDIEDAE